MSRLIHRLRGLEPGSLSRNVATLMSGTLIAQAIAVVSTPVLSRLFTPEHFGLLGLVNAIAMVLSGIAAWRYDMAIVIPEEEPEAVHLLNLSLLAITATCLVAGLFAWLGAEWLASALSSPGLTAWVWAIPAMVGLTASYNALTFWCTRRKQFRRLSISAVLAAGASLVGKVAGGFAGLGPTGLVGGQLGGQLVASAALAVQVLREDWRVFRQHATLGGIASAARAHQEFPRYQAPLTLLNQATRYMPVYLLGAFFGAHEVGLWSLTVVVLSTPVYLVSNAVRRVLYQRASELWNAKAPLLPLYDKVTLLLLATGALPTALGALTGPWLFQTLLGAEWADAGSYARYAVLWQLTVMVSAPAVSVFPVVGANRLVLGWQIVSLTLSFGALVLGARYGSDAAVAFYCLAVAAMNIALVALVRRRIRSTRRPEVVAPGVDSDGGGEVAEDSLLEDRRRE